MAITVKKRDVADYLKSADDIAAYLEAVTRMATPRRYFRR
jgi:DNA-binding phage protein